MPFKKKKEITIIQTFASLKRIAIWLTPPQPVSGHKSTLSFRGSSYHDVPPVLTAAARQLLVSVAILAHDERPH